MLSECVIREPDACDGAIIGFVYDYVVRKCVRLVCASVCDKFDSAGLMEFVERFNQCETAAGTHIGKSVSPSSDGRCDDYRLVMCHLNANEATACMEWKRTHTRTNTKCKLENC